MFRQAKFWSRNASFGDRFWRRLVPDTRRGLPNIKSFQTSTIGCVNDWCYKCICFVWTQPGLAVRMCPLLWFLCSQPIRFRTLQQILSRHSTRLDHECRQRGLRPVQRSCFSSTRMAFRGLVVSMFSIWCGGPMGRNTTAPSCLRERSMGAMPGEYSVICAAEM